MIEFRPLPDDHPDLQHSPLLRLASITLQYAVEHGHIPITQTKAFKRSFVYWAVERCAWPDHSLEDMLRYHKVINEADFPPLEMIHYLLLQLKLGRHYKTEFRPTKAGLELAQHPGKLFDILIPMFIIKIDHASYSRFAQAPFGKWDVWLNVMNFEADQGSTEAKLYKVFYGDDADWDNKLWREIAAFSACVLRPLEWAGFFTLQDEGLASGKTVRHVFKTTLWRSALKLDLDGQLPRYSVQ